MANMKNNRTMKLKIEFIYYVRMLAMTNGIANVKLTAQVSFLSTANVNFISLKCAYFSVCERGIVM